MNIDFIGLKNIKRKRILFSILAGTFAILQYYAPRPSWFPQSLLADKKCFLLTIITAVFLFNIILYTYTRFSGRNDVLFNLLKVIRDFVEKKAIALVIIISLLMVFWFGLRLFNNPFEFYENHGNGAYYAQVLHNVVSGHGPEHTTKYTTHRLSDNPYYYASAFSLTLQILPPIILAPIYALHPVPPMHVMAVILLVFPFGGMGTYVFGRVLGVRRWISVLFTAGFLLLPWVDLPVAFHGAFDVLGYAIFPWVLVFLFGKRFKLFYVASILLGLINIAYVFILLFLGFVMYFFFGQRKHAFLIVIIGIAMYFWEMSVMSDSLCAVWLKDQDAPNFFRQFLLSRNFQSLIAPIGYHIFVFFDLMFTLVFIPIFGLKINQKWNRPLLGCMLIGLFGLAMGLFRSYSWEFQRSSTYIVPFYFCGIIAFQALALNENALPKKTNFFRNISIALFSILVSVIIWYPHGYIPLLPKQSNELKGTVLDNVNKYVPMDASIAYYIESGLQAYITNRRSAWHIGEHPDGVEFYVIQKNPIEYIDVNLFPGAELIPGLKNDSRYQIEVETDLLIIFKNRRPAPPASPPYGLGWGSLYRGLLPGGCPPNLRPVVGPNSNGPR